jgi:phage gpG-like protein
MARIGEVKFVIGTGVGGISAGLTTPVIAMDALVKQTRQIGDALGELTRPFNIIAPALMRNIKKRFDTGAFGHAPYQQPPKLTVGPFSPNPNRSKYTRLVRQARGQNPDGSALKASGTLKESIYRVKGPTSTKAGRTREVAVLRIGSNAGRRARQHIFGGQWIVEVKIHPKTKQKYLNAAAYTSNPTAIYNNWRHIVNYEDGQKVVEIPTRDFFMMSNDDRYFINSTINKYLTIAVAEGGKTKGKR